MPDRPRSRVVLITGASSGIGLAAAHAFAAAGSDLILAARSFGVLQHQAEEIERSHPGLRALPVKTDVSILAEAQACVEAGLDQFGRIDLLVNNAGQGHLGWLEDLRPGEDIEASIATNLCGMIWMARAVLPPMLARRSGHVINVGSLAGFIATPTYSIYAATKFAVRGFTEALRREVSVWGIQVSGLYPGAVTTDLARAAVAARRTGLTTPAWLRLSPEGVAEALVRLARRPRPSVVIPAAWRPVIWLNALWPGLIDRLAARWFVAREREQALRETPSFPADEG